MLMQVPDEWVVSLYLNMQTKLNNYKNIWYRVTLVIGCSPNNICAWYSSVMESDTTNKLWLLLKNVIASTEWNVKDLK